MTPKELGRLAKKSGINAPTLDFDLARWLKNVDINEKKAHYVEWWEGWYEVLSENISFQNENFTRHSSAA